MSRSRIIRLIMFCIGLALLYYETLVDGGNHLWLYVVAAALLAPVHHPKQIAIPLNVLTEGQRKYDDIEPMSSSEFEAFYGWGEMPERFWPREHEIMAQKYARGEITIQQLEDGCDDMMGLTRLEGYRND